MSSVDNKVKITVSQGIVIGQTQPLPDGRQQFVFKGIPYAQQPIGHLRFRVRKLTWYKIYYHYVIL